MPLKIFVDFDGTITRQDVGNAFFVEFGGKVCSEFVEDYRAEKISAKELFRKEVEAIGVLDEFGAITWLRRQEIDESFRSFADFCRERKIELYIVSDGLDFYIGEILRHNSIDDVTVFANHLEIQSGENDSARLSVSFPYDDAECSRCACCKRNIMLTNSAEDDTIVYVGEGYSDRCPARYADFVFAKDDLQKFCQRENISYFLYSSFDDVVLRLEELLGKKKLRPRREAEMKRREAFIRE
ncbi:MAG: MtnX-like HAD-IB family phosphatase [bacterium]